MGNLLSLLPPRAGAAPEAAAGAHGDRAPRPESDWRRHAVRRPGVSPFGIIPPATNGPGRRSRAGPPDSRAIVPAGVVEATAKRVNSNLEDLLENPAKYPVGGAPDYNAGQMTGRGHSDVEAIGPLPARLDVVPVHHPPPAGFCRPRPSVDSHRRAVRFRRAGCSPGGALLPRQRSSRHPSGSHGGRCSSAGGTTSPPSGS